jgi:hypothetical protein
MSSVTDQQVSFNNWETVLDPENLTLLSILEFRQTKANFSYDIHKKNFNIFKFLANIVQTVTDAKWVSAAKHVIVKVSMILSCYSEQGGDRKESGYVSIQLPKQPGYVSAAVMGCVSGEASPSSVKGC